LIAEGININLKIFILCSSCKINTELTKKFSDKQAHKKPLTLLETGMKQIQYLNLGSKLLLKIKISLFLELGKKDVSQRSCELLITSAGLYII